MKDEVDDPKAKKRADVQKVYDKLEKSIIQVANLLNRIGYDKEGLAIDGSTPLLIAVENKNIPMIKWLLNNHCKIVILFLFIHFRLELTL